MADYYDEDMSNGKKTSRFLVKTFNMVSDPNNYAIVHWNEAGDEFIVKNEHDFASILLPTHFRHKNFSSFVRQLNFYGFRKRTTSNHYSCFKHADFRRDNRDALSNIKRKVGENATTSGNTAQPQVKDTLETQQMQVSSLQDQYSEIWKLQHHILFVLSKFMSQDNSNEQRLPPQHGHPSLTNNSVLLENMDTNMNNNTNNNMNSNNRSMLPTQYPRLPMLLDDDWSTMNTNNQPNSNNHANSHNNNMHNNNNTGSRPTKRPYHDNNAVGNTNTLLPMGNNTLVNTYTQLPILNNNNSMLNTSHMLNTTNPTTPMLPLMSNPTVLGNSGINHTNHTNVTTAGNQLTNVETLQNMLQNLPAPRAPQERAMVEEILEEDGGMLLEGERSSIMSPNRNSNNAHFAPPPFALVPSDFVSIAFNPAVGPANPPSTSFFDTANLAVNLNTSTTSTANHNTSYHHPHTNVNMLSNLHPNSMTMSLSNQPNVSEQVFNMKSSLRSPMLTSTQPKLEEQ